VSESGGKIWPLLAGRDADAAVVEVLVARHPQTEANVAGAFVGTGESPLTRDGLLQADALAACIAAWGPTIVLASPRERARVVGEQAARLSGVDVVVLEELAEIDFGEAEGLTFDEAKLRGVEIDLLGGPPESAPFADGETWHAFAARVALAAGLIESSGGRVAVVTHGGVVRALITQWLDMPHRSAWRLAVGNATVATLTLHEGHGTLRTFGTPAGSCGWENVR
jgi:broad specificity phosphatase PhoE